MPTVARLWLQASWLILLLGAAASAKEGAFKLRGQILPPLRTLVFLTSHDGSFADRAISNYKGRFKFKKLKPGTYAITLFHPYWGETRRTIEVTGSFADEQGRIDVSVPFRRSEQGRKRMLRRRTLVSAKQLSISSKAWRELRKARRKLSKDDAEAAAAHLEKAVEISPQFMIAWNFLGTIAYREGQLGKAEEYFRKALGEGPEAYAPTVNLGGALLALGRYSEALPYNRTAAEMRPDDALANAQVGVNYFFLRKYQEAERPLLKAKSLDPSHFTNPQLVLAQAYEIQGRSEEAIAELREFLARHPDSAITGKVRLAIEELESGSRNQRVSRRTATGVLLSR